MVTCHCSAACIDQVEFDRHITYMRHLVPRPVNLTLFPHWSADKLARYNQERLWALDRFRSTHYEEQPK